MIVIIGENKPMHKKYNIRMEYTKSVLWTSCVVILLRDVSIAQQHLWLWQSVAIIIYCFSFCLWTLPSVYWVNIEWTHVELYDLSPINLRLWWMYHHLCGCDEVSPPLSLACSFGCIIPSVFTCWSEHTVSIDTLSTLSHVKPRFCF